MMDLEDLEKMEALRSQIALSDGWKIEMGTMNLGVSHYIFMSNYNQLKDGLEFFDSKPGSKLWHIKNRDKMQQFKMEIMRLFHNYLASVKSLVEHTRIIIREVHGNNRFSKECDLKIRELFDNSALSRFVQDFRNYILHKGIPLMYAQEKAKESIRFESTNSLILDLSSLKSWAGWKAKSKEYLDNAKEDINLYDITISYGSLVNDFYTWFSRRQEELFKEQFDQTQKLKDEYNKIVKKYMLSDEEIEAIEKR